MPATIVRNINASARKLLARRSTFLYRPPLVSARSFADYPTETSSVHFRATSTPHPLATKGNPLKAVLPTPTISGLDKDGKPIVEPFGQVLGDHTGLLQNHIWKEEELKEKLSTLYHHKPQTITDHVMQKVMYSMYYTFNFLTGYKQVNPSVQSIEWRLIVLESVAGVPGFVAAGFRHFRSLRTLERDHGWIATLLEEAENERMHLLLCLNKFEASYLTRILVITAQQIMVPVLMGIYLVNPTAMHRFVGYLEETACHTYVNIIDHAETPGTHLYEAWHNMDASPMAKGYYKLPDNAKWVDTLKCIMADEAHHRDVNHTFADMKSDDPNPFVTTHKASPDFVKRVTDDVAYAWRLEKNGSKAWSEETRPALGTTKNSKSVYKTHFSHH